MVRDARSPPVLDTIGTDEHYDAPVQKKALKRARDNNGDATTTASNGLVGFKEKASHRLVDVSYCHIAAPAINDALRRTREGQGRDVPAERLQRRGRDKSHRVRECHGEGFGFQVPGQQLLPEQPLDGWI